MELADLSRRVSCEGTTCIVTARVARMYRFCLVCVVCLSGCQKLIISLLHHNLHSSGGADLSRRVSCEGTTCIVLLVLVIIVGKLCEVIMELQ